MKLIIGLLALWIAAAALAYNPQPVQRSAAETQLTAALEQAKTDAEKVAVAKAALEANPEDIPLGRAAQDVLLRAMDDPAGYFKARAEGSESIAAHFLWARASDDTTIMASEADWILKRDANHFWGYQMAAIAEWSRAEPDLALVRKHLEASVAADPSRPEGYLNLGYLFEELDNWKDALAAFEAGALADPAHKGLRDARLTAYAELRDAANYFKLFHGTYPAEPLEADLPRANAAGRVTTADLRGAPTVLEYWAYT